jgi:hypothetical protein
MERRWTRVGAIAGVAFAVAQVASGILPGTPPALTASGSAIALYLADHRSAILVAALISALAAPLFLVVVGALWSVGRDDPSAAPLRVIFAAAAAVATAVSLGGSALQAALAWLSTEPLDAAVARPLYAVQTMVYVLIGAAVIAMVPAASAMLRRANLAGTGLVWLGWIVAGAMLVSQFALLVESGPFKPGGALVLSRDYPFAVWVLWLCWALWRANRQPSAISHQQFASGDNIGPIRTPAFPTTNS